MLPKLFPSASKYLAALLFLVFCHCAEAWNNVGHRAIAEMAWNKMDRSEQARASALLKEHPHYKEILTRGVPAGLDTNHWAFLMASVWPDMVRPSKPLQPAKPHFITKYDLYPHAIGHPFLRKGDTNYHLLTNFFIATPNAEMVLSNSIATLNDRSASGHDRAISLCWTLHLLGDLHQPLHAASLVTDKKPRGDGLGGDYLVTDPRPGRPKHTNLHSLWDQLLGVEPTYKTISEVARKLSAKTQRNNERLRLYRANKSIASWVQESFQTAVKLAYAEDRVRYVHKDRFDAGEVKEADFPILRTDYLQHAEQAAEDRVLLASWRLTDVLRAAF